MRATALLLSFVLSSRAALAGAPSLPDSLQACAQEHDDTRRLVCYDDEVARLNLAAQHSIGLSEQQQRKLDTPEGKISPAAKPPAEAASISNISRRPDGRYIFMLDNGQVWIQGEAYQTFEVKVGDAVTIKAGMLGSFHMRTASGADTRVMRAR